MHARVHTFNQALRIGLGAALCALSLAGCGDGDHLAQVGAKASKGGVSGGPMAGTLTVQAVDADTALPLAGAAVWLRAGEQAQPVGRTAADGRLTLSDLGAEPQTVTVSAAGHEAASWGLITSSLAVIPLESTSQPGTTDLAVDLPGWSELPPLPAGMYRIARFAYSRPNGLSALEADAAGIQPQCRRPAASQSCSVTLSVPLDTSAVLAVVAEANDAGTPDDVSDDAFTMTGLGLATEFVLRPVFAGSVSVTLLPPGATARASVVALGSGHEAFEEVVGVPGVSIGGQILLYPSLGGASTSFLVPTASGAFANAKLWAVATANNGSDGAWSRSYQRGVAPPRDATELVSLQTNDFLELPSIRSQASGYSLSSPGNLVRLEFSTPSGQALNVLLFPAQSEFELPQGVLDEPPNAVSIEAFDATLDPRSFDFQESAGRAARIAYVHAEPLR